MDLGKPGHPRQFEFQRLWVQHLGTVQKQFNPLHGVITQYRIDCAGQCGSKHRLQPLAIFGKDLTPTRVPLFEGLGVPKQIGARPEPFVHRQTSWIEKDFSSSQDLGQTRQDLTIRRSNLNPQLRKETPKEPATLVWIHFGSVHELLDHQRETVYTTGIQQLIGICLQQRRPQLLYTLQQHFSFSGTHTAQQFQHWMQSVVHLGFVPSLSTGVWVQEADSNIANIVPPLQAQLTRRKACRLKKSLRLHGGLAAIPHTGKIKPLSKIFGERLPSRINFQIRLENPNGRFRRACGLVEQGTTHRSHVARVWFGDPKLHPEGKIALRNLLVHERCEAVHANGPRKQPVSGRILVRRFEMGHDQLTPTSSRSTWPIVWVPQRLTLCFKGFTQHRLIRRRGQRWTNILRSQPKGLAKQQDHRFKPTTWHTAPPTHPPWHRR